MKFYFNQNLCRQHAFIFFDFSVSKSETYKFAEVFTCERGKCSSNLSCEMAFFGKCCIYFLF